MATLALINPRRGKRRKASASVAPRKRRRKSAATLANPRRRRLRKVRANPRSSYRKKARSFARKNTRYGKVRAYRRRANPRLSMNSVVASLVPAMIGAGGGIGLNIAMKYLPLPASMQNPLVKTAIKLVGAGAIGYGVGKVFGRSKGIAAGTGAATVVMYTWLNNFLAEKFPQLGLSTLGGITDNDYSDLTVAGMGYVNPAPMLINSARAEGMGAYMANGLGAYMQAPSIAQDTVNSANQS